MSQNRRCIALTGVSGMSAFLAQTYILLSRLARSIQKEHFNSPPYSLWFLLYRDLEIEIFPQYVLEGSGQSQGARVITQPRQNCLPLSVKALHQSADHLLSSMTDYVQHARRRHLPVTQAAPNSSAHEKSPSTSRWDILRVKLFQNICYPPLPCQQACNWG